MSIQQTDIQHGNIQPIDIEQVDVVIPTPDGEMPASLYQPTDATSRPAVLLLMEAFGLTAHIRAVAERIAHEGYVVLAPDLYYRDLPHNRFGYDDVERAMAMMYRLDFGQPMEADLRAAVGFLNACPTVQPRQVGVTGFCLGGGLAFLTACRLSDEIAAVAPFYGMVLDEWIDAIEAITVPIYLFHGGIDPFISHERIQQIESRFKALEKEYQLKIYPDAKHGFFCHERSSYHPVAAADAWQELVHFLHRHLKDFDP